MHENPTSFKYDAFISYRHSEPDKTIAARLHRMLETFKVPKAIVKRGSQKRVGRVFRDRDELPTSSNLAENIRAALTDSEHLIVICSPRTPQSEWVVKEIETFGALHGHDHILALLIEGEPSESFPDVLRYVKKQVVGEDGTVSDIVTEIEPLAADIRDKSLAGMKKKLKVEILRLLAPILNCRFDDLKQRHRERMIKRVLTISISLSVFFLGFGSITAYQSMLIRQQSELVQEKSEQVQQQAELLKQQVQETLAGQSLYLADVSKRLLLEGDRRAAILVALEALPKNPDNPERPYREEAELALCNALRVYDTRFALVPDTALEHDKYVNFIKLSSDGSKAVSAAQDGYLYIWDTEYGHLSSKFFTDDPYLEASELEFIDDSTIVFAASGKIISLNTETMTVTYEIDKGYYLMECAFSPDKSKLAVITSSVEVIDTANGEVLFEYDMEEHYQAAEAEYKYTSCISFDAASRYLLMGTSTAQALVADLEAKALAASYTAYYNNVQDMVMTADGRLAVISTYYDLDGEQSGSGYLEVFKLYDHERLMEMALNSSSITNLTLYPGNDSLLMFTQNNMLQIVDMDERAPVFVLNHGDNVMDYIPLGDMILTASTDGTIRVFLLQLGGVEYEPFRVVLNHSIKSINLIAGRLAVCFWDSNKALILRDLENADSIIMEGSLTSFGGAHMTKDGKRMLSYNAYGELMVLDLETYNQLAYHEEPDSLSIEAAFFVDQDSKIFCVYQEKLVLYDAENLGIIRSYESDYQYDWAFNSDLSLAVVKRLDTAEIIRTADLTVAGTIENVSAYSPKIFPDGSRVLFYDNYHETGVYDMKTGQRLTDIPIKMSDAVVSPDGKTLACVVNDTSIRLLDAQTFGQTGLINVSPVNVEKLCFDPSGKTLFVVLDDHSVHRYSLDKLYLMAELEDLQTIAWSITFNQDKDLYAITTLSGETIVCHDSSNKRVAEIERAYVVDPEFRFFICMSGSDIVRVPFYDLRALMAEAQRQLGGRVLTDKEKARYFISD